MKVEETNIMDNGKIHCPHKEVTIYFDTSLGCYVDEEALRNIENESLYLAGLSKVKI